MNYEALLARAEGRVVQVGLIGVGEFGRSLLAQSRGLSTMKLTALCDREGARLRAMLAELGFAPDRVASCDSPAAARRAFGNGQIVVTEDSSNLAALPLDVVVEATGNPQAGARNAERAIAAGQHVVMVTKETDSVVGPYLSHLARKAGKVYTLVEGDQPALLIGLISWARTLGLDIVAAGKSSEYDYVYDPAAATVTWRDTVCAVPGFDALWAMPPGGEAAALRRRAEALRAVPLRTTPDYCEMCLVANATGLMPDDPAFHAPVARTIELPDILRPRDEGGLVSRRGAIEVFNCLRRPDEASFAGGVFVLVAGSDRTTCRLLKGKGIPVDRDDRYALLYNPSHLLGVEAPITILSAGLLGLPSSAVAPRPVGDVVARTTRDLARGHELSLGERHSLAHVDALLMPARRVGDGNPIPFYMAAEGRLVRDVPAGTTLTADMVELAPDNVLRHLRAEQDALFALS